MKKTTIRDCSIIEIGKHHNKKGNISVVENDAIIPFNIKRVYYYMMFPGANHAVGMRIKNFLR